MDQLRHPCGLCSTPIEICAVYCSKCRAKKAQQAEETEAWLDSRPYAYQTGPLVYIARALAVPFFGLLLVTKLFPHSGGAGLLLVCLCCLSPFWSSARWMLYAILLVRWLLPGHPWAYVLALSLVFWLLHRRARRSDSQ